MKYKLGDKVKYDGGDWWFYGTVSAVFEHSICPCYRISVERMEKKNCKLSITQFEFELEADFEVENAKNLRKWEKSEIDYLKKYYGILNNEDISKVLNRSIYSIEDKWKLINQDTKSEQKKESIPEPEKKLAKFSEQKNVELQQKPEKRKRGPRGEAWFKNYELYIKGVRTHAINAWVAYNRRQYKADKLPDDKIEKLLEINFTFDTEKKKSNGWERQLEEWKKGERKKTQQWKQRSIKKYVDGKLTKDKIEKLKEVGILK